jgi:nitronate monooxygenase
VSTRWQETAITAMTGCRVPIIAAPMAGGPSTPELVAAVGDAGGFGVLGGGYLTPEQLREEIAAVRRLSAAPFGVNLFVPEPVVVTVEQVSAALEVYRPYFDELDVPVPQVEDVLVPDRFDEQLAVVVAAAPALFSFTFGIPTDDQLAALRTAGIPTLGTATTASEAIELEASGVDSICVQGKEAGGHRGTFRDDSPIEGVGLRPLLEAVTTRSKLPVVAAGGLMDGAQIAAVLQLGAAAAQLGTAFLLCPEAATSPPYRAAVASGTGADTVLTAAFSGRPARGLRNRVSTELAGVRLPAYPVTNRITRSLRAAAAKAGDAGYLSLWAAQGVERVRTLGAGALTQQLVAEVDGVLGR